MANVLLCHVMLTKPLAVRLPEVMMSQLQEEAVRRYCSMSDVARDAIRIYLKGNSEERNSTQHAEDQPS